MSGRPVERQDPFQDEVTARYDAQDVARLRSQYPSPKVPPPATYALSGAPPAEQARFESGVTPVRRLGAVSPSAVSPSAVSLSAVLPGAARKAAVGSSASAPIVPMHILRQVVACYSEFLGLAARPVVIEQMRDMGLTPASVTISDLPRLVIALARRLDTSRAEHEFYSSVRGVHPMLTHL